MSSIQIGFSGVAVLLVLIGFGIHIPVSLALVGFGGVVLVSSMDSAMQLLGWLPYNALALFAFVTMPLFILMGEFAHYTGASTDAYSTCYKWLGNLTGGLAMAVTAACALFGACSGSSIAAASTMARISYPELKKFGYDRGFSAALIAASGSLAVLIPPSVILILYAMLTNTSLVRLLLAGFIPGILSAFMYMLAIYLRVKISPKLAPKTQGYSWREKIRAIPQLTGIVIIVIFIIGGMYLGIFTASEAAATGAILTLVMALLKRTLSGHILREAIVASSVTTCSVFFIVFGAFVFGKFLSLSGVTTYIITAISTASLPPIIVLIAVLLLYLALGCVLEAASMLAITLPIIFPVIVAVGYDPIWFGIICVKMVEIAVITPPLGLNVFAVKGVLGNEVPLERIFANIMPFLFADFTTIILLTLFPQIALYLPNTFGG
jgi:C4-dicarboxylate transporter, DctM subunit